MLSSINIGTASGSLVALTDIYMHENKRLNFFPHLFNTNVLRGL